MAIKDIYHLSQSTANRLIYSGKRDGGLGFPKLEIITISSCLRAGIKFLESNDPVMRAVSEMTNLEERLKKLSASARLNWPAWRPGGSSYDSLKSWLLWVW